MYLSRRQGKEVVVVILSAVVLYLLSEFIVWSGERGYVSPSGGGDRDSGYVADTNRGVLSR